MRTIFVFLPEMHNHGLAAVELQRILWFLLRRHNIEHSTRDFWDDEMGYAKYGVRLDIASLAFEDLEWLLGTIVYTASFKFGSIEIQLDENCTT